MLPAGVFGVITINSQTANKFTVSYVVIVNLYELLWMDLVDKS